MSTYSRPAAKKNKMAIDAYAYRNVAAFINFSCQPNLEMKGVEGTHGDKDFKRVAFFAKKTILVGCELGYTRDVNSGDSGKNRTIPCYCNAAQCKGFV
mmetsp:Transcript_52229/g.111705  ORF Transcript_52229/g.111705 Transcript_52229/m.111705 type:complete len:98 (+) Transcript_52229:25-318(+)